MQERSWSNLPRLLRSSGHLHHRPRPTPNFHRMNHLELHYEHTEELHEFCVAICTAQQHSQPTAPSNGADQGPKRISITYCHADDIAKRQIPHTEGESQTEQAVFARRETTIYAAQHEDRTRRAPPYDQASTRMSIPNPTTSTQRSCTNSAPIIIPPISMRTRVHRATAPTRSPNEPR
jgi:hypothetical protein